MAAVVDRFYGTGRRKTSVARVWIRPGSGRMVVNRRAFEEYFSRETNQMIIAQPLQVTNTYGQFDVVATVTCIPVMVPFTMPCGTARIMGETPVDGVPGKNHVRVWKLRWSWSLRAAVLAVPAFDGPTPAVPEATSVEQFVTSPQARAALTKFVPFPRSTLPAAAAPPTR